MSELLKQLAVELIERDIKFTYDRYHISFEDTDGGYYGKLSNEISVQEGKFKFTNGYLGYYQWNWFDDVKSLIEFIERYE